MRLLCDEMLHELARWLRAAGYDTAVAEGGRRDRELIADCGREARTLLTRDRHLAAAAAGKVPALLLAADDINGQASELGERLAIDWLRAPFTICLVDNAPLLPAQSEAAAQVPQRARAAGGPLRLCPVCGRLYWPGSHVHRMQARLAGWAGLPPDRGRGEA